MARPTPVHPDGTAHRNGWCARVVSAWRNARRMGTLNALEPHDRSRILAEAGLHEQDLPAVLRAGHVADLLPAALRLHGVDGAALDDARPDLMHDLQRVCAHCHSARTCQRLLAQGAPREEHERLCPNAGTLASLR